MPFRSIIAVYFASRAQSARLERLGALHEKGVLTDEEFAAEKARVLGSGSDSDA